MPTLPLYNSKGEQAGEVSLADGLFGVEPNEPVVHQAVTAYLANQRQGTASTRTRGMVSGGGKKPYRQKGTGRARQGTRRAPHYPGGGVVFGPHPRDYRMALPKKMRALAFASALSDKVAAGRVTVVDQIAPETATTKAMAGLLAALGLAGQPLLVVAEELAGPLVLAARNLAGVDLVTAAELNTYQVVSASRLLVTKGALERLEGRAS